MKVKELRNTSGGFLKYTRTVDQQLDVGGQSSSKVVWKELDFLKVHLATVSQLHVDHDLTKVRSEAWDEAEAQCCKPGYVRKSRTCYTEIFSGITRSIHRLLDQIPPMNFHCYLVWYSKSSVITSILNIFKIIQGFVH